MKICNAFSSPQNIVQFKPISFLCLYLLIYSLENTAVGFKVMILCQNFVFCLSQQHPELFSFYEDSESRQIGFTIGSV